MSRFLGCIIKYLSPGRAGKEGSEHDRHGGDNSSNETNESHDTLPEEPAFRQNDTYRHVKDLQEGNEGQCSVMRSQTTGRLFVIKTTRAPTKPSSNNNKASPRIVGRRQPLPNEAKILLTDLHPHPNIIRCFAVEPCPLNSDRHLLFLEYCSGGDLLEQLRRFQAMKTATPELFTLHVFIEMAQALAYLHHGLRFDEGTKKYTFDGQNKHNPIIHGDIKPDNIFLRCPPHRRKQGGRIPDVVLADFGMSQPASTSTGATGTPTYDSPEVLAVESLKHTDAALYALRQSTRNIMSTKSDIYSLGLVLHLVATRRHFKTGADPETMMQLPERYEGIRGFGAALVWCLQGDPHDRPECSGSLEEGLLFGVEALRGRRDALVREVRELGERVWDCV